METTGTGGSAIVHYGPSKCLSVGNAAGVSSGLNTLVPTCRISALVPRSKAILVRPVPQPVLVASVSLIHERRTKLVRLQRPCGKR